MSTGIDETGPVSAGATDEDWLAASREEAILAASREKEENEENRVITISDPNLEAVIRKSVWDQIRNIRGEDTHDL